MVTTTKGKRPRVDAPDPIGGSLERRVVAGILLAAGESKRMGSAKALLPWLGTTLVDYQVHQMLLAGISTAVVVLGHGAVDVESAIYPLPDGVRTVVNPAYREGRSGSIRTGARSVSPEITDVLIASVDQPRRASTLALIVDAHLRGSHPITVPTHEGRRGHPPVIARTMLPGLLDLSEEQEGLRGFMRGHASRIAEVAVPTSEVLLDLNTQSEYQTALRRFGG
jgi:molybdenum cofactor cytidylyltransferase